MILENTPEHAKVLWIDRDLDNINLANENLKDFWPRHISVHDSFENISDILDKNNFEHIDFILYDLGVSSAHYDDAQRGFSFRFDGPLDMRFNRTIGKTAHDIVMNATERELMQMFSLYADEKKSPFIARAIVQARKTQDIDTTFKLLSLIKSASFDKKSPLRVFQALRITVNDEFWHIERSLSQVIPRIRKGWIITIITFHSIEDRLIKNFFKPHCKAKIDDITGQNIEEPLFQKITKKPIIPTPIEIQNNPRARSAKLRAYKKNL